MNSQKCTNCGLVAWAETEKCKRCGESLLEQSLTDLDPEGPETNDRKRKIVTALAASAVLVLLLCAAVPFYLSNRGLEGKPFKWRNYVSAKGGYKIQLPDEPKEGQETRQTASGPVTLNRAVASMGKRGEYVSGYYSMSFRPNGSEEEFLLVLLKATLQPKDVVLTTKPIAVRFPAGQTVKALESEIQVDASTRARVRLYWVTERAIVYMNIVTYESSTKNEVSAERFLNSFELNWQ